MRTLHVIDSHTAGEPTRIVIDGGPDLGAGSVAERLQVFRTQHDRFRSAVVNEPRGSDVLVGALLVKPSDPSCVAGVIFFNNVGTLGMCGHGTIGLITTLAHMGRIKPGTHRIETNVGIVAATLHSTGEVSVQNVPSYRKAKAVAIDVPDLGASNGMGTGAGMRTVRGDVAWAGNWFYLVQDHGERLELNNCERLTDVSWRIRQAINAGGYPEVDHVELFAKPSIGDVRGSTSDLLSPSPLGERARVRGPGEFVQPNTVGPNAVAQPSASGHPTDPLTPTLSPAEPGARGPDNPQTQPTAHSRNFVMCPGKAYDRSPCGTGTSAKLACLAADGKLAPGETWIQESIVGTRFTGSYQWLDQAKGVIVPTITGRAFVNAESKLLLADADPFCWGIRL